VVDRDYAWALKGLKTFSEGLFLRSNRFSTVAAMSVDGIVGEPLIVLGSVTQDMYSAHFASEVLRLQLGSYPSELHCAVMMDDCAVHDKQAITHFATVLEL
jgi:hypothetical protein